MNAIHKHRFIFPVESFHCGATVFSIMELDEALEEVSTEGYMVERIWIPIEQHRALVEAWLGPVNPDEVPYKINGEEVGNLRTSIPLIDLAGYKPFAPAKSTDPIPVRIGPDIDKFTFVLEATECPTNP